MHIDIPKESGTYILLWGSNSNDVVAIGSKGILQLEKGYYLYIGSAFGPGGIKARVQHHRNISPRPHWHMDYLRKKLQLLQVWYWCDPVHREHEWAELIKEIPGISLPMKGFGASDCRCLSHLFFCKDRPVLIKELREFCSELDCEDCHKGERRNDR